MHKIIAIVAAAACAAVIVGLIPEPEPAAAAITNAAANDGDTADAKASCFQNWPYYERSCLHDGRQEDGNARAVRVIAINQHAAHRGIRQ
jgi:hypothetical protein